jgi:hypothetical protein
MLELQSRVDIVKKSLTRPHQLYLTSPILVPEQPFEHSILFFFLGILFIIVVVVVVLGGGTLWHLQKFL